MSRHGKVQMCKTATAGFPMLSNLLSNVSAVLSPEEIKHRTDVFAQFSKNLVGFREGKQSSCRGAWTAKEYSNVRLMLRQIPKPKAFEMWAS
jgi:hypothetical protein